MKPAASFVSTYETTTTPALISHLVGQLKHMAYAKVGPNYPIGGNATFPFGHARKRCVGHLSEPRKRVKHGESLHHRILQPPNAFLDASLD
jgi:hypothetical protein